VAVAVLLGGICPAGRLAVSADPSTLGAGFTRLLALLDTDPQRAATAYAAAQHKLARFFEWRGCPDGQLYADITLERVAGRLGEGAEVTAASPYSFIMGFAHNVLREYLRGPDRRVASLQAARAVPVVLEADPIEERSGREMKERRLACLDRCVGGLPAEQRRALLQYHDGRARARIDTRKALAESFSIPVGALRLRMFRIRESLERCILQCLAVTRVK